MADLRAPRPRSLCRRHPHFLAWLLDNRGPQNSGQAPLAAQRVLQAGRGEILDQVSALPLPNGASVLFCWRLGDGQDSLNSLQPEEEAVSQAFQSHPDLSPWRSLEVHLDLLGQPTCPHQSIFCLPLCLPQPPGNCHPPVSEDLSRPTYASRPRLMLSPKALGTDGAGAGRGLMPAVATYHLRS